MQPIPSYDDDDDDVWSASVPAEFELGDDSCGTSCVPVMASPAPQAMKQSSITIDDAFAAEASNAVTNGHAPPTGGDGDSLPPLPAASMQPAFADDVPSPSLEEVRSTSKLLTRGSLTLTMDD